MNKIIDLPLVIFPSEILQRLGYHSNQMLMKKVRSVLMPAMDEARALAHPQGVLQTFPLIRDGQGLHLEGTETTITDPLLLDWMQNCTRLSVFAVTLGTALEDKIQAHRALEEETHTEVLEAVRSDALEQAVNVLCNNLIMQGVDEGFQLTHRYDCVEENVPSLLCLHLLEKAQAAEQLGLKEGLSLNNGQASLGMIGWIPFEALESLSGGNPF